MTSQQRTGSKPRLKDDIGNVLILMIAFIAITSMYGVVMVYRTIIDADSSAWRNTSTQALYLADSGIQMGRRYLVSYTSQATLGPFDIGNGSVTVEITPTRIYYPDDNTTVDAYGIVSTGTISDITRQVVEYRHRGGLLDKEFLIWWEVEAGS